MFQKGSNDFLMNYIWFNYLETIDGIEELILKADKKSTASNGIEPNMFFVKWKRGELP